jgi:hypothetical protein
MMHKMHDGIESDNLFFLSVGGLIGKISEPRRKMTQQQTARLSVPNPSAQGSVLGRLPKNVRRVGAALQPNFPLLEFEVVVGNASYCEGEHFYLTAEQARRAYHFPKQVTEQDCGGPGRHCERSEAIHIAANRELWIASSLRSSQ